MWLSCLCESLRLLVGLAYLESSAKRSPLTKSQCSAPSQNRCVQRAVGVARRWRGGVWAGGRSRLGPVPLWLRRQVA